ncbi:MAG: DIP1984 family protein [Bacteroidaceae bacterium]|nr:DIP1984 family protein [Bacteroidaceae bacterium]
MKLAEALAIRKDTQKRIEQLKSRILNNVRVQEGDEPSESPSELMKELDSCLNELQTLVYLINKTNMHTVSEGKTLTQLMAEKDILGMRVNALRDVFNKASESQDRYSRSEIKMVTTIDIKPLGRQIDKLSKELRELDIKIQGLNFITDLEE